MTDLDPERSFHQGDTVLIQMRGIVSVSGKPDPDGMVPVTLKLDGAPTVPVHHSDVIRVLSPNFRVGQVWKIAGLRYVVVNDDRPRLVSTRFGTVYDPNDGYLDFTGAELLLEEEEE